MRASILNGEHVSSVTITNKILGFSGTVSYTNGLSLYDAPDAEAAYPGTLRFLSYEPPPRGTLVVVR
jgi:hypothetical protein